MTPGPWEVAPEGTYPSGEGHKVLGPWGKNSQGVPVRFYVAQFLNAADARAIAALPELREAAKALLTHSAFDVDPQDVDEEDRAKERALSAALAKMDGMS